MPRKNYTIPIVILFLFVISILFQYLKVHGHGGESHGKELSVQADKFPGITWIDDIHPIFIRNKCYSCHTRGEEDFVDSLSEFALGIIDPENPGNAFYSFRELVYTEGPPKIMDGENLRDGQCCWPRGFPKSQQRRIWLGHPERSVLLRKLEHDYYDWNDPPRYLEEGLRLSWGLPMPLWNPKKENIEAFMDHSESLSPSIWKELVLRTQLLFGKGLNKLYTLPAQVPYNDKMLIRQWISYTIQTEDNKTILTIKPDKTGGRVESNRSLRLVGNYVTYDQNVVSDTIDLVTDSKGSAEIKFKEGSIISLFWHVGIKDLQGNYSYKKFRLVPGNENIVTY